MRPILAHVKTKPWKKILFKKVSPTNLIRIEKENCKKKKRFQFLPVLPRFCVHGWKTPRPPKFILWQIEGPFQPCF